MSSGNPWRVNRIRHCPNLSRKGDTERGSSLVIPDGQAAALILDLDDHALGAGAHSQRDGAAKAISCAKNPGAQSRAQPRVDAELVASAPELVDRTRDRIVQATVQRQEFIRAERRVHVHSQVGNGLAPRPL